MENQHTLIKGYRDLSQEEITAMNSVKEMATAVGAVVDVLQSSPWSDKRWVSIAKTDLQKGFMAAVRSIAQPTTF